ncbi:MAG: hypothetical protein A3E88_05205 [Legionellales bacterium RIFCSPHIGHO2_12_FULL_35_11]|nr:MAG: hypothetical protein A3E88_05205 [Legionellales bacterium RIFCSPHIGHO2_12_FULL_35_11]
MIISDNFLKRILTTVNQDLIIGAANKKNDLERTGSWSAEAVEHSRLVAIYEKNNKNKFAPNFKLFRVFSDINVFPFVSDGANGKFAMAGNCQEHVGLSLYYLFFHSNLWSKIEVLSFEECFDHVFIRITGKDKIQYYFDSWANLIFKDQIDNHFLEICNIIISGMEATKKLSVDQDEILDIDDNLIKCNHILESRKKLGVFIEEEFYPHQAKIFISQFDKYYETLISETYPKSLK